MKWNFLKKDKSENQKDNSTNSKGESSKSTEKAHDEITEKFEAVVFFPGTKQEYEHFVGYEVEIIDRAYRNKGVFFLKKDYAREYECEHSTDVKKHLVEQGIEAIINCHSSIAVTQFDWYEEMYGLPVARKKNKIVEPN